MTTLRVSTVPLHSQQKTEKRRSLDYFSLAFAYCLNLKIIFLETNRDPELWVSHFSCFVRVFFQLLLNSLRNCQHFLCSYFKSSSVFILTVRWLRVITSNSDWFTELSPSLVRVIALVLDLRHSIVSEFKTYYSISVSCFFTINKHCKTLIIYQLT